MIRYRSAAANIINDIIGTKPPKNLSRRRLGLFLISGVHINEWWVFFWIYSENQLVKHSNEKSSTRQAESSWITPKRHLRRQRLARLVMSSATAILDRRHGSAAYSCAWIESCRDDSQDCGKCCIRRDTSNTNLFWKIHLKSIVCKQGFLFIYLFIHFIFP